MLRVALDELVSLRAELPHERIFGADIDSATAEWASHLVSSGVPSANLLAADFLALRPGLDLPTVEAVVGNPPYVRHHWLTESTRKNAVKALREAGVTLSGRASLWAYFVIHACGFVQSGGRMALLLPGSALQADYSAVVLDFVRSRFEAVVLVRVEERIFDDANEETVVLLASGRRDVGAAGSERIVSVPHLDGMKAFLQAGFDISGPCTGGSLEGVADWKLEQIDPAALELFERIRRSSDACSLGDVARVAIGTVTGANGFFVLRPSLAQHLRVEEYSFPIVARSAWLEGPEFHADDLTATASDDPCLLMALDPGQVIDGRTRLGRYIQSGRDAGLPSRRHCRRDPWWAIGSTPSPDAFLSYMVGVPRGLSLNPEGAGSTNTVHQVTWTDEPSNDIERSRALSSWSSFGTLAWELYGRSYGGGVLKLEISEAKRLPVVDSLRVSQSHWDSLRQNPGKVRAIADTYVATRFGLSTDDVSTLRAACSTLAARRTSGHRRSESGGRTSPVSTTG